jgi:transposase InsO family protein
MRELELRAIRPRRFVPRTTDSRHGQQMSPNLLLERGLKVERPRQVIVGDITYLPLQGGGWAYLATRLDLYSRKIAGWQVAETWSLKRWRKLSAASGRLRAWSCTQIAEGSMWRRNFARC